TENGYEKLKQQNVDFGGGLMRIVMAVQDTPDAFLIDIFEKPRKQLERLSTLNYGSNEKQTYAMRVIMDHLHGATFLIADGVVPSNKDQGYFTRRLIRRAVRFARDLGIHTNFCADIASEYINTYKEHYDHLEKNKNLILSELSAEEERFRQTLEDGLKHFERGEDPFILYTTYGFPIEVTEELAKEKGVVVDRASFDKKMEEHQKLSRAGGEQKFKGGLADTSEATIRLHTAHHLLLAALREILGDHVHQRGSNITAERLRIDFAHTQKVTPEELKRAEDMVNAWIQAKLPMTRVEIPREEAEKVGAQMEFGAKYPDMVSVYFVGENLENAVSKEFCGGPHVKNTGELGTFKIQKEEAVAQGIRRIKAVLA
ncbi:MAG TPA: alanine--tRNA ligase-related protein, partial [Candidatus Paceibacterota bacterium]